jgi:hypothetical protein
LGLGDKESRTSFTHVNVLGYKNVMKIHSGGNHSWVVLDDLVPVRDHYIPPSPCKKDTTTKNSMVSPAKPTSRGVSRDRKSATSPFV